MGGSEGFGGDNLTFRKTKGEISRNCEPKKGRLLKTLKGFRGEGGGGGGGPTQICLDNDGSRELSIVIRGDHFNEVTFRGGIR